MRTHRSQNKTFFYLNNIINYLMSNQCGYRRPRLGKPSVLTIGVEQFVSSIYYRLCFSSLWPNLFRMRNELQSGQPTYPAWWCDRVLGILWNWLPITNVFRPHLNRSVFRFLRFSERLVFVGQLLRISVERRPNCRQEPITRSLQLP